MPDRLKDPWFAGLIALVGLVAGLCLALGTTAALEMTQNPVRGERDLVELLPVAILAGIPLIVSPGRQQHLRRRIVLETALASGMMAVIVAGNLLSYYKG